jgi:energy-converting hydrogenase Eha subunit C
MAIVDVYTTASLNEPTSTIVVLMARPTITELDH